MELIDGKKISSDIKKEIAAEVAEMLANGKKQPHLAAVLVGHDGGSETYVAAKVKACEECGFKSTLIRFEDDVTEEELLATVDKLNNDADIDGFIIGLSPRLIPYGNDYWVAGQNYRASVVTAKGELTKTVSNTALVASQGNDIVTFSFKGDTYAFATDYDPGTSGDATTMLYNGRAVLLDGNAGWADATNAGSYPSAGMSSKTRNTTMSSSICVNVNGDKGVEMWVLVHNQGIAYYKSGTVPTYQIEDPTDPIVTPSVASLSFSTTEGYTDAKTLTVSGERLTGNITLSLSGSNANQFKLSTTSIALHL